MGYIPLTEGIYPICYVMIYYGAVPRYCTMALLPLTIYMPRANPFIMLSPFVASTTRTSRPSIPYIYSVWACGVSTYRLFPRVNMTSCLLVSAAIVIELQAVVMGLLYLSHVMYGAS